MQAMNNLLQTAAGELARFLSKHLPSLSAEWWSEQVKPRLSFQQQRLAQERGIRTLQQLDLAALLRLFNANWRELAALLSLPCEAQSWLKELQTVHNKWTHLSPETIPASERYRDADTLCRLLELMGSRPESLAAADAVREAAVLEMAQKQSLPNRATGAAQSAKIAGPAPFQPGDLVVLRSQPEVQLPILAILPSSPERRYEVFQEGAKAVYYESQLRAAPPDEQPPEALSASALRARLTAMHLLSASTANLFSLRTGRIEYVPYQYRPVMRLIRSDRPRLLIADEVGVGKTIETGLILKELQARRDLSSALVLCPKALVAERKWELEMKRFDEEFTALDGKLLRHCLSETDLEGHWPARYAKAILPFSLVQSAALPNQLNVLDPPPQFNLVVVDEAHHIRNPATNLHKAVRIFCENAEAVVLLTATPVQMGDADLFHLLNILRPDIVIDTASFQQMAEPNRFINQAIQNCRAPKSGWQQRARACLQRAAQTEWGQQCLCESPVFQEAFDSFSGDALNDPQRVAHIRDLEELYTFSGLINRTRRRDIGEFTVRKPETITTSFTPQQKQLHDGLLALIAKILIHRHGEQNILFMMTMIRRQAASCIHGLAPLLQDILAGKLDRLEASSDAEETAAEWNLSFINDIRADIENLLAQANQLDTNDPKADAFKQALLDKAKRPNNKALVFSTFRHTLAYLLQHARQTGLRCGLIHGGIPDAERADLRRRFALSKEHPAALDILLSSEVGCEGLDFQFCDMLLNYDLPWNPMKIEQRIGRIDRYGQKSETVAIINLITSDTVDADIYHRCLFRIGIFQHTVGGNEAILGDIAKEIRNIGENFRLTETDRTAKLQQLADNHIRRIEEEQKNEERQAELFGLNIPPAKWKHDLQAAENHWLTPAALQQCVAAYLSDRLRFPTEHLQRKKPIKTLRLTQTARAALLQDFQRLPPSNDSATRKWEKWLKGSQPALPITFTQAAAAADPQTTHLWPLHPLIRQAARHLRPDKPIHAALLALAAGIPPGDHPFALYCWRKQGVKKDETLEPVAAQPAFETQLLSLLQIAENCPNLNLPPQSVFDQLETRHHQKWTAAKANHIETNQQTVAHRRQSLHTSHQARLRVLKDQIQRAKNDKIKTMKQSQLTRAEADYQRRIAQLQNQAASGDIHTTPVLFGIIKIIPEK